MDNIFRIYYEKPCKESLQEAQYIIGTFIGYPETDKHLKERLDKMIKK